ncbi:galanin prepropeptide, gene 2 L homeolog precursor [Xenopus laevis]|uniref:Galanin peptides n=1 Tax=Xenopus laevis TaxID=8355 RepID=B7SNG1_XENLA|nr:galanin prepropeptide, gene 2 L homeolog precursor [Xenopus laevis]ACC96755.1 galanin A [Xenopus laevis]
MRNCQFLLCISLLLCGMVTESFSFALLPKDKRGWTLNSAGYLLGPHAHRTLTDKVNMAGKREAVEDIFKSGRDTYGIQLHSLDDDTVTTILEFLSYLRLKELGALDHLAMLITEDSSQS